MDGTLLMSTNYGYIAQGAAIGKGHKWQYKNLSVRGNFWELFLK